MLYSLLDSRKKTVCISACVGGMLQIPQVIELNEKPSASEF